MIFVCAYLRLPYLGIEMKVNKLMPYLCYDNDRIESVKINIERDILNNAFYDCKSVKSISINAKNIGESAFSSCNALETLTLKADTICVNAFKECATMNAATFDIDADSIGVSTFSSCSCLESFKFGKGMKTIGQEAFSDCTALTSLESHTKVPPTCGANALDDINKWTCKLHVPEGTKSQYAAADLWKDFFFVEDDLSGIDGVIADNANSDIKTENGNIVIENAKGNISIYTLSGAMIQNVKANGESVRINVPAKGMYIVKTSKGAKKVAL